MIPVTAISFISPNSTCVVCCITKLLYKFICCRYLQLTFHPVIVNVYDPSMVRCTKIVMIYPIACTLIKFYNKQALWCRFMLGYGFLQLLFEGLVTFFVVFITVTKDFTKNLQLSSLIFAYALMHCSWPFRLIVFSSTTWSPSVEIGRFDV